MVGVDFAADIDFAFGVAEAGEAATFSPVSGGSSSVTVIVNRGDTSISDFSGEIPVIAASRNLFVRVSEVAAIEAGDTFTIGSETITVNAASLGPGGAVWEVEGYAD